MYIPCVDLIPKDCENILERLNQAHLKQLKLFSRTLTTAYGSLEEALEYGDLSFNVSLMGDCYKLFGAFSYVKEKHD